MSNGCVMLSPTRCLKNTGGMMDRLKLKPCPFC